MKRRTLADILAENSSLIDRLDDYIERSLEINNRLDNENRILKGNADRFREQIRSQDTKIARLETELVESKLHGEKERRTQK